MSRLNIRIQKLRLEARALQRLDLAALALSPLHEALALEVAHGERLAARLQDLSCTTQVREAR